MKEVRRGWWCLHCERVWHWVRGDVDGLLWCADSRCDGGMFDLFPVEGVFEHGEAVQIGSERFVELREKAVFEEEP